MPKNEENLPATQDTGLMEAAPDFMGQSGGQESLKGHIAPPVLLICQSNSSAPIDDHPKGTPLIMPLNEPIGEYLKDEKKLANPIVITPIAFWPEFVVTNPRSIKEKHGSIRERSLNPGSEIAQKAKRLETFPCPESPGESCKYTTRFNYVLWIHSVQQAVLLTLKSTEVRTGTQFNSLLQARNRDIYGCQFLLNVVPKSNSKGDWFGFTITNPTRESEVSPWITDKALYDRLAKEHEMFNIAVEEGRVDTGDDEHEGDTVDATSVDERF